METETPSRQHAPAGSWGSDQVLAGLRHALVGSNRMHATLAAELGINSTGLSALNNLDETPNLTPKQLSERLGITTGSTTGATDALQKAGFLAREPHPDDRRSVVLNLTPAGRHAIAWILDQYQSALNVAYAAAPETTGIQIATFLEELANALNEAASSRAAATDPPA